MEQQRIQREEEDYNDEYNDDYGDFNDFDEDQSMDSTHPAPGQTTTKQTHRGGFTREPVITRPPTLVSGAGHDALAMADAMPVAMLFVRSKDGKSHSPDEYTPPEDIACPPRVLYKFLQTFTFPEDEESDYVTYYDLP